MGTRRGRRRFVRAGDVRAAALGLSERRTRELTLSVAWEATAGASIARRVRAVAVRRGTLVLEASDPRWIDTVRELIPRLAGRLAGSHPELGVRRVRLERAVAVDVSPIAPEQPVPAPERPEPAPIEARDDDPADRLERVMRRYLERAAQNR